MQYLQIPELTSYIKLNILSEMVGVSFDDYTEDDVITLLSGNTILNNIEANNIDLICSYLSGYYDVNQIFKFDSGLTITGITNEIITEINIDTVNNLFSTSGSTFYGDNSIDFYLKNPTYSGITIDYLSSGYTYSQQNNVLQTPDRRYPIINRILSYLMIYDLYSRANPSTIPDFVTKNKDEVIVFLAKCADKQSSVNLPYAVINSTEDKYDAERQIDTSWNTPNNIGSYPDYLNANGISVQNQRIHPW